MTYHIQNTEGQNFSAESLNDIQAALSNGTINQDCIAWHEGLPEWLPVMELFPADENKTKETVIKASKILLKAGGGIASFAAKKYKHATIQNRFSKALTSMLGDGVLDESELEALRQMVEEAGSDWKNVVLECSPIAEDFIRHLLADAIEDGVVTPEEESLINYHIELFSLQHMYSEVSDRISKIRKISALRNNQLPAPYPLTPPWLKSGEAIYLCSPAKRHGKKQILSTGNLWITSMRVEYIAENKSLTTTYKTLRGAESNFGILTIITSRASGNVLFTVDKSDLCAELILCLMRISNRTVNPTEENSSIKDRRKISQQVRQAVWIRDGGICRECNADDYLEYDHVIPVSKGGDCTVRNIQLLCRRCNGSKGNRI